MSKKLINGLTAEEYLENLEAELFTEAYESLGSNVKSNARTMLIHVLKFIYQNEKQTPSWCVSIVDTHCALCNDLIDKKGDINKNEFNDYLINFDSLIVPNAIKHASEETGLSKNKFEIVLGISPRALFDKDWIIKFLDMFITKEHLRKNTIDPNCEQMRKLLSVNTPNKNSIRYLDKEVGKVEYVYESEKRLL